MDGNTAVKLYRTSDGPVLHHRGKIHRVADHSWDQLISHPDLHACLLGSIRESNAIGELAERRLLAPIGTQAVWAAGVTYYRSRDARMSESKDAGGGDFYDRVYSATRPELFFKATAHRVAGPGEAVRIRSDASWSVPEPELTLIINPRGQIIGYTVGNDMSSRDIEGENPLYLPQAKVYDRSCALGPCILVTQDGLPPTTAISLEILRAGKVEFAGSTTLAGLKRSAQELVNYLFRDNSFPAGAYLMTGTGIVPSDAFSLRPADRIRITIEPIGTLENTVVQTVP